MLSQCLLILLASAGCASGFLGGSSAASFAARLAPQRVRMCAEAGKTQGEWRCAGPQTPKPAFSDASLFDRTAIRVFREALAHELGGVSSAEIGYAGIMDLARELNRRYPAQEARRRTRGILRGLFPDFIIKLFPLMFAQPMPAFSAKLNAAITSLTCKWLMGPNTLLDVDEAEIAPSWGNGVGQGLLIERCRFLEESGCASVCINTCKVPTQDFFIRDMGIPLSMEPDYDTFECRFKFGKMPLPQQSDDVFQTQCFAQCPSRGALRDSHAPRPPPAALASDKPPQALCDTIEADGTHEPSVPSAEVYRRKLMAWARGEQEAPP